MVSRCLRPCQRGAIHNRDPIRNFESRARLVREAVPLIYIGTDRSLRRQLPSQQYSLLRRIFEDINEDFQDPENKVTVRDREGKEIEVARTARLEQLLKLAMSFLRTDEFKRIEASIKQNVLEQLGLDAASDDLDLYFTPMSSMDFYKNLDLVIKDHGFSINATEVGQGFQSPFEKWLNAVCGRDLS